MKSVEELRCPSCYAEVRRSQSACPGCGSPLTFDPPEQEDAAPPSPSAPDEHQAENDLILVPLDVYDEYRPIPELSHWLIVFLIGIAIIAIVSVGSGLVHERLLAQIERGVQVTQETAKENDSRQFTIAMLELGTLVTTGMLFATWTRRAYWNLHTFGMEGLKFSPQWAMWGYFVPFLNIVRPYHVMTEIWRGSDPTAAAGTGWARAPISPLVRWWWGLYLAMNCVGWIAGQLAFRQNPTVDDLRVMTQLTIASNILTIVAAAVAAGVVHEIMLRQAEQRDRTRVSISVG